MEQKLKEFAVWAIRESAFDFHDLDGYDVHKKACELGLLVKTTYDPAIHGECEYDAVPGDDWWVFCDELKSC